MTLGSYSVMPMSFRIWIITCNKAKKEVNVQFTFSMFVRKLMVHKFQSLISKQTNFKLPLAGKILNLKVITLCNYWWFIMAALLVMSAIRHLLSENLKSFSAVLSVMLWMANTEWGRYSNSCCMFTEEKQADNIWMLCINHYYYKKQVINRNKFKKKKTCFGRYG